jgi:hypothetical protein
MSQTLTPDVQTAFLNTLKQLLQDQTQLNQLWWMMSPLINC